MDPVSEAALSCRGLVKHYGSGKKLVRAVDGLDLEVRRGECFGLLGPNGAGKTTTIEVLEGLTKPTAGEVHVLGRAWKSDSGWLRQRIGVSLQETNLSERLTVEETLRLFVSFFDQGPSVNELLARVSLEEKRGAWYLNLSGGQKQRLAVACALAGDPDILFLDEPTTGLDPQSRRQMWEMLREQKAARRTILISTHYMEEAERLCDRVAVVDHGKVIALGTPAELIGRLGGGDVVEVEVDAALEMPSLQALPSVTSVALQTSGASGASGVSPTSGPAPAGDALSRYLLHVGEPHLAVPALLACVTTAGRKLVHLSTRSATLEDVFVALTGRHLRD